ncbi:MAG: NAD(+) diphosphatase [Erysipelotrichaceae bacterium]
MIQDIAPHILINEFKPRKSKANDLVFIFQKEEVWLIQNENQLSIPLVKNIKEVFDVEESELLFLFQMDDYAVYTILNVNAEKALLSGDFHPIRIFRTYQPSYLAFAGITASHLAKWYTRNQYCGSCGNRMEHSKKERAMICPSCSFIDYPKICPAMIIGVKNKNKILLSKYANRPFTQYALLAGFCEIGESLEETIQREVMEEVGVSVKNPQYYASQPWGFSQSLLVGFFVELDGDETITLDTEELKEARWVEREEIPDNDENVLSLTHQMMQAFKKGEIL